MTAFPTVQTHAPPNPKRGAIAVENAPNHMNPFRMIQKMMPCTAWQVTSLPGITTCTGGSFIAAVDPYLRSIGPNGDIYVASVGFSGSSAAILANKSTDGGLHWTMPLTIDQVSGASKFVDKPST